MSCLPKPVLRGHIQKFGLKIIAGGIAFAAINSSLYYFFVKVPYQRDYAQSMKKYDQMAHYNDLVKWGYIQFGKDE